MSSFRTGPALAREDLRRIHPPAATQRVHDARADELAALLL